MSKKLADGPQQMLKSRFPKKEDAHSLSPPRHPPLSPSLSQQLQDKLEISKSETQGHAHMTPSHLP